MFFPIFWAVLAGAAFIAELMTGTLYLLVLGLAFAAAGATSFYFGIALQLVTVTVSCAVGLVLLRRRKQVLPQVMAGDIGSRVEVLAQTGKGTYRVRHSGTEWDAFIEQPVPDAAPELLIVVGVEGTRLKCKLDETTTA